MREINKTAAVTVAVMAVLAAGVQGAIVISDFGSAYTQDFDSLPSSGTNLTWANNSTISGWHRNYAGTTSEPGRDLSVQSTGANNSGVSTQIGYLNTGVTGNTDRSVTLRAASYATEVAVGAVFQNDSGSAATGFSIGYTGEQWRRATATACSLYFEYAIVSSLNEATLDIQADDLGWIRVDALEFVSPQTGAASGLNGSNPAYQSTFSPVTINATVADGSLLVIRWLVNDPTNNHALGIDDVSVTMIPEPATAGLLGIAAVCLILRRRLRK